MTDTGNAATASSASETKLRRQRSRLPWLVGAGLLLAGAATWFRTSTWAHEYQLRNASLAVLRERAATNPSDPLLYYYLGTKSYNAHSLGEAGVSFERATALDPKLARAYVGLAIVQRDAGQWPLAYQSAKQAQQLQPKDADTQFLIGMLVMHTSPEHAIPEFQKVVERAPRRADAWYWIGWCRKEVAQMGEAIEPLRKAVALEPKNPVYRRDLGNVLFETNAFADARRELEASLAIAPNDPQTSYFLGEARMKLAQSDADLRDAEKLFTQSLNSIGSPTPENASTCAAVLGERSDSFRRLRELPKALRDARLGRQLDPTNLRLMYLEAEALRAQGKTSDATRIMTEFSRKSALANLTRDITERIKQDPKDAKLRLQLARLYLQGSDFDRAANQYQICLQLDKAQPDAKRELAALVARHPNAGASFGTPAAAALKHFGP